MAAKQLAVLAVTVALTGTLVLVSGAGKPSAYTTCDSCVAAGFGWSKKKGKCGGFANKVCASSPPPPTPPPVPPPAPKKKAPPTPKVPMTVAEIDAQAAELEAARKAVDAANMEDAYELALDNPANYKLVGPPKPGQTGGAVLCGTARENQGLSLRCPGFNTVTKVLFASYGAPRGQCGAGMLTGSFQEGPDKNGEPCHSPNSKRAVEQACLGNTFCEVDASNRDFGDPCYGTGKMLAAVIECSTDKDEPDLPPGVTLDRPPLPPLPRVTMQQLQLRPDLLLGDKPFAVLDGETRNQLPFCLACALLRCPLTTHKLELFSCAAM
jgi:hypothetical protein